MKNIQLIVILLSVFLISIAPVYAYEITYIGQDNGGTTIKTDIPSVYWLENCDSTIYLRTTAGHTSGIFTVSHKYLSPFETVVATSNPQPYTSNITCLLEGGISGGSSLSDFYEASTNTTHSAETINTWIETVYDCDFDSDELFIYNNTASMDHYGNHPFGYGSEFGTCFAQSPATCSNDLTGDLYSIIDYLEKGYYTDCGIDNRIDAEGEEYHVGSCGGIQSDVDMNYWIMVPFNSMASGYVNFSVFGRAGYKYNAGVGGTFSYQNQYYLWDTVDNTTTDLGTTFPITDQLTLIPEREYWFFIGTRYYMSGYNCGSGGDWGVVHNYTQYSISTWAYEPEWNCTDWSECTFGTQFSTCIDPDGRVADIIETRVCSLVVLENATLGFEDYYGSYGLVCVPDYNTLSGCYYIAQPQNKTRKIPVNWSLHDDEDLPRDYITMSSKWAKEGSLSLKMWYIPPSEGEPTSLSTCGNSSTGITPILDANTSTIIVETNVTFPADNMVLNFWSRGCHDIAKKHDGVQLNFLVGYINCSGECYGDCLYPPYGQSSAFRLYMFDIDTGEQIIDYFDSADWNEQEYNIDFSNSGVTANHNYTIRLMLDRDDWFTQTPQCVLFDDMNYWVTDDSLDCTERCIDGNLWSPSYTQEGLCVLKVEHNSDQCFESETDKTLYSECEEFCIGDDRYIPTDDCIPGIAQDYTVFEDSPLCLEAPPEISPTETDFNSDDAYELMFNVPFWIGLIVAGMCVYIPIHIKKEGELVLVGIGIAIIDLGLVGLLPLYFTIIICLMCGLGTAFILTKTVKSGG